jgi:hypothetical protein
MPVIATTVFLNLTDVEDLILSYLVSWSINEGILASPTRYGSRTWLETALNQMAMAAGRVTRDRSSGKVLCAIRSSWLFGMATRGLLSWWSRENKDGRRQDCDRGGHEDQALPHVLATAT